jgi:quinol monooxygenase YgiN
MQDQISRIVKMTFRQDSVEEFLVHFHSIKERIRHFPGCNSLKLIRSIDQPNILFTYSIWNAADDLENYRNSDLFKETWTYVKGLFESKAEAWSTLIVAQL